jgi:histidinol-phosphate phosphatase family protein
MNALVAAVFFDKDGTLVDDVPYNIDPLQITLARGAAGAVRRIAAAGYEIHVVSNQSGVARGYFPEACIGPVELRLRRLLEDCGVALSSFRYCPHHPEGVVAAYARACRCRKPQPGMLLRAASEHGIDLRRSWMIGDILDDVEAGRRAGCRTVLIDNGNETEWRWSPEREPDHVVRDLIAAAEIVCAEVVA